MKMKNRGKYSSEAINTHFNVINSFIHNSVDNFFMRVVQRVER